MDCSLIPIFDKRLFSLSNGANTDENKNSILSKIPPVDKTDTNTLSPLSPINNNNNMDNDDDNEETEEEDEDSENDPDLDFDDLPVFHSSSRRSTLLSLSPSYACTAFASTPRVKHTLRSPLFLGSPAVVAPFSDTYPSSVASGPRIPSSATPTVSLYIGDLHTDTTETMLYTIFSTCGPISSVKICRDSQTQRSLGYGYVNYLSKEAADTAINELGYTKILGRECRVSRAVTALGPGGGGGGGGVKSMPKEANICVKNLHPSVDSKQLWSIFKAFGTVISCKVATNPSTGQSLCRGYVQYEEVEHARLAIRKATKMVLNGQAVAVDIYLSKEEREQIQRNKGTVQGSLKVTGIPNSCSEQDIHDIFSVFAEIHSVYFTPHSPPANAPPATQNEYQGNGWGFVNYNSFKGAVVARNILDGYYFHRSCLRVALVKNPDNRAQDDKPNMAIVRRLVPSVGISAIVHLLKKFTFVDPSELTIQVYRALPGHSVKSCSIECKSGDSLYNIVANLNERQFFGHFLIAYVACMSTVSAADKMEDLQTLAPSPRSKPQRSSSRGGDYNHGSRKHWRSAGAGHQTNCSPTPSPSRLDREDCKFLQAETASFSLRGSPRPRRDAGQGTWRRHFYNPDEQQSASKDAHYESARSLAGQEGRHYGAAALRGGATPPQGPYLQRSAIHLNHVPRPACTGKAPIAGSYYFGDIERVLECQGCLRGPKSTSKNNLNAEQHDAGAGAGAAQEAITNDDMARNLSTWRCGRDAPSTSSRYDDIGGAVKVGVVAQTSETTATAEDADLIKTIVTSGGTKTDGIKETEPTSTDTKAAVPSNRDPETGPAATAAECTTTKHERSDTKKDKKRGWRRNNHAERRRRREAREARERELALKELEVNTPQRQ